MKQVDDIKKYFKEARINTNENKDNDVFNKILDAANKNKTSVNQLSTWRIIMKSRITKLAVAAVIIVAVVIGINYFGGSIDGASVAWAEIVEKVEQSYDEYYVRLLSAMEEKDVQKASANADALSEFWQGLNILAEAKMDPTIPVQSEDSLKLIEFVRGITTFDEFDKNIFQAYADEFLNWLNKIEDEAWLNEVIHISKELEEYAEEMREPDRHPEIDFSYAEHCLAGFVTYCKWFEQLPWNNPERSMMPGMVVSAIERDLKIARREIEAMERRDADRCGKRCMQQALRNAQYLDKRIKSYQMVDQWKLCKRLNQKIGELSGLMSYLAIASGDITQTNKVHDPEAVRQILISGFANEQTFAAYFIKQADQALNLCGQLHKGLEYTQ